ncbi:hypothetical protein IGS68_00895 [Skermanella sp. TT6]|uniref:Uncharacterized protein n=1 Tax=Skermanella cutis TaxID=2775420 RepID=A0ABX7B6A0_9PROT|nr:hypothetical protein [Skermanella sp. TT6]QQP89871.1 hypothetical protein IGS68_00895 [Skermanella sp. TT6]
MDHVRRTEPARAGPAADPGADEDGPPEGTGGTIAHAHRRDAAHKAEFTRPSPVVATAAVEFTRPQDAAGSGRARIKAAGERRGCILDPDDTSLTGGVRVTPADLLRAAREPRVACYTITDDITEDDIHRMLFEEE